MRPRPVVGEATVPDAVRRLLDKFDYPDREAPAQIIPILPTLGGGGGAPTIVVAASDSSQLSKERADLICIGSNDEDVINAAILSCIQVTDGYAGRVLLAEGYYIINNVSTIFVRSGVTLQGLNHRGVHLQYEGAASMGSALIEVQGGGAVRDLQIIEGGGDMTGNIGIDATTGTGPVFIDRVEMDHSGEGLTLTPNYSRVTNCWFNVLEKGISVEGDWSQVRGCYFQVGSATAIEALSGASDLIIVNNSIEFADVGILLAGSNHRSIVSANMIEFVNRHGIQVSGSSDCMIQSNVAHQPGQGTDNTYDGIILDGNSDRNDIWHNRITGKAAANQPRYGINVSAATCDDNSYLGNRTGPAANYGTGAYNDAGTGTINTWPGAAAPQGDNLL